MNVKMCLLPVDYDVSSWPTNLSRHRGYRFAVRSKQEPNVYVCFALKIASKLDTCSPQCSLAGVHVVIKKNYIKRNVRWQLEFLKYLYNIFYPSKEKKPTEIRPHSETHLYFFVLEHSVTDNLPKDAYPTPCFSPLQAPGCAWSSLQSELP